MAAKRVLVMRFSSVGDVVLASPAVHALKLAWPDTDIVWAIKSTFAPLVAHNPHVDRVVPLERGESFGAYLSKLRAVGADAILDLQGKLRTRALRALLPGRKVAWTKRPWQDNLPVRLGLRPYRAQMPISDRYHQAVEALVGQSLERGDLRHWVGVEDQAAADAALEKAGVDLGAPIVGMSPGAKWETKRWPVERYAALAAHAREKGAQIVLTGTPDEQPLAAAVRAVVADAHDLTGTLDLATLAAVIERCSAYVANDSGPMHIARALGVPTLTFFGSTDPNQFEFDGHHAIFLGLACSPCHFYGRTRCPKGHFKCMLDIDADQAATALTTLLDSERPPHVHA